MNTQTKEATVGDLLRQWRVRRHLSQLELAHLADVSSRHLSFIESGRAKPSREMILKLAKSLQFPLRQVNAALNIAGFSNMYSVGAHYTTYTAPLEAMRMLLKSHEPYPALIVDNHWNLIAGNDALGFLFADVDPMLLAPPVNTMRLSLHPKGLAPHILNLREWGIHIFERLARDITNSGDEFLVDLRTEIIGYDKSYASYHDANNASKDPVVPLKLSTGYGPISIFGMTTIFGVPNDITLSELAIESFFPADVETERILRTAAQKRGKLSES